MEILIFTTPTCKWCIRAKEFMDERGLKYKEIDARIPANKQRMVDLSKQMGIPVLVIDGEVIVGYNGLIERYGTKR